MKFRFAWLALAALAVILAGCKVSVIRSEYAPSSLMEQTLVLTNDLVGGPLDAHPQSLVHAVSSPIKFHFKDRSTAFDSALNEASSWSYRRDSSSTGTVTITFPLTGLADLITTCRLTFQGYDHGTHRCGFEVTETRTILRETTRSGWGEGTFLLERLE